MNVVARLAAYLEISRRGTRGVNSRVERIQRRTLINAARTTPSMIATNAAKGTRCHASSRDPRNFIRSSVEPYSSSISFFPRARDFPGPRHAFLCSDNSSVPLTNFQGESDRFDRLDRRNTREIIREFWLVTSPLSRGSIFVQFSFFFSLSFLSIKSREVSSICKIFSNIAPFQ